MSFHVLHPGINSIVSKLVAGFIAGISIKIHHNVGLLKYNKRLLSLILDIAIRGALLSSCMTFRTISTQTQSTLTIREVTIVLTLYSKRGNNKYHYLFKTCSQRVSDKFQSLILFVFTPILIIRVSPHGCHLLFEFF